MADKESLFVLVLEEEKDGGAELKFDIAATRMTDQEQQKRLIEAEVAGKMVVLADLETVVHGTLSKDGTPASLVVVSFCFLPGKSGKRFKSAEIKVIFTKGKGTTTSPEVLDVGPAQGTWGLEPTDVKVDMGHVLKPSVQAGKVQFGYEWNFTEGFQKKKYARVESAIRTLGSDRSKTNAVTLNLYENPVTKGGIPSYLRAAILLAREKTVKDPLGEKFAATVDIHGEPGWRGRMKERAGKFKEAVGRFLGKSQDEDPSEDDDDEEDEDDEEELKAVHSTVKKEEGVIFNPEMSRGNIENENKLLEEDLGKLKRIVMLYGDDNEKGESDKKPGQDTPEA
ncbi:hypothetical protein DL98DRAFT_608273 [Cadophora sp. DSE1049]|nr:hypothetical protein DL98DRAFT_608273 [Cadophora sp. DSE1049]